MTTSTGEQDVVDILTTDHREAIRLVEEIPAADPGRRRDLTDTVIAELMRHSVAEEMHVYPAMREHLPDGEAAVKHDIEEHRQLEEAMKALKSRERLGSWPLRRRPGDGGRKRFSGVRRSWPRRRAARRG